MNKDKLPGTVLELNTSEGEAFDTISQILRVTGGITLAQLGEIAGVEGTTIQNWVKRGWVDSPKNKRYTETSTARVIIINMLRNTLQLSSIVELMAYVNGLVGDRSDDIIPDSELYNKLCRIVAEAEHSEVYGKEGLKKIIAANISDYREPYTGARRKLEKALLVMTLAYLSSELKKLSQAELDTLDSKQ